MRGGRLPRNLDRYAVHVVDRALDVLETLRDSGRPVRLQDVAQRLAMAKSSVFRLLCTLERRGYVDRTPDSLYRLGAHWLSYRDLAGKHPPLTEISVPHMRRLLDAYGETVNLGVLREGKIVYLEMLESAHSFRMAAAAGTISPVHSTALGKAIAAFLPESVIDATIRRRGLPALTPRTITSRAAWKRELARTRVRGYAEDNGETEPEVTCIGAPIFGFDGNVIGAISVSGPASRMRSIRQRVARAAVDACAAISRALGPASERRAQRGG